MGLFDAWRSRRRFARLDDDARNLVFYSESAQDWHHFAPIIERLTGRLGRRVCYVTSDPEDCAARRDLPGVSAFCIGKGTQRTIWFQFLRADVLVLTMMDLGNFELKRSIHPVHYVYMFHGMGSTHMVDFANSYDHYDSVLCAGPHQMREIRRREELAGLPAKRLIEHGYARLEALIDEGARDAAVRAPTAPNAEPTLLIAPTWGDDSILNRCGEPLVRVLLDAGYRVIVRPHYHTRELTPEVVDGILAAFRGHERFEYVDRMGESESLFRSDLLISDWSAMALEYALGLAKPVLFVDVPRRVRNPGYVEYGLEPIEASIRNEVGRILDPEKLEQAPALVEQLLADPDAFRARAERLRGETVFNLGSSADAAADAIAAIGDEMREARAARG